MTTDKRRYVRFPIAAPSEGASGVVAERLPIAVFMSASLAVHRSTPIRSRLSDLRYGPAAAETRTPAWVKRLAKSPCEPAKGDCPTERDA